MKITTRILKKVLPDARFVNVPDIQFDWIDALSTATIRCDWKERNILCFLFYLPDPEKDGWYDSVIDKRGYFEKEHDVSTIVFVVDSSVYSDEAVIKNKSVILVDDLFKTAKCLFDFVLEKVRPSVIGVTGSIGKTTAVSMIEDVLSVGSSVLRVYSKRITPLSLFTAIINNLEYEHSFVVMEYSLYRKWHVEYLASLLRPSVAVVLNVTNMHIGNDGIDTEQDIFDAKVTLTKDVPIKIFSDDLCVFVQDIPCIYFGFSQLSNVSFIFENGTISVEGQDFKISPYVLTELGLKHILMCLTVLHVLQIPFSSEHVSKIQNFKPKEHRLLCFTKNGKTIIFDGEVTYSSRLLELSKNYYEKPVLVILNLYFGIEKNVVQFENLKKALNAFEKVYINENITGINSIFEKVLDVSKNITIISNPVEYCIAVYQTIFIHDGGYWRFRSDQKLSF